MVHALEKVIPWLVRSGNVLIILDLVDPPQVEVHVPERQYYSGRLLSNDNYINENTAYAAVDLVIQAGTYFYDQSRIFENCIRADSLSELVDYLEGYWSSAYFPDGTREKIEELVEILGENSEIVLRMLSRIIKLDLP